MPAQPTNSGQGKGVGPHFSQDATALTLIYQAHGITHEEYRANLARVGVQLDSWPEGVPHPVLYKLWAGIDVDLDDEETDAHVIELVPPPPLPLGVAPDLDEALDTAKEE